MKKFAAAVAVCFALSATAALANTTVDAAIGNTMSVTEPDGTVLVVKYNADNTYTLTVADHTSSGTWAIGENDTVCMTAEGGSAECHPVEPGHAVGETWNQGGTDGPVTVSITAGQ